MALSIEEMQSEFVEAVPAREVMCGGCGGGYSYSNHQYQSGNGNFDGNNGSDSWGVNGNFSGDLNGNSLTIL